MSHEAIFYDVIIVGAGPAGLSAAIRLKQRQPSLNLCVLEKGAQVGSHLISGAVLDPSTLKQLLPEHWDQAPFFSLVQNNYFYYLTKKHAWRLPTPRPMQHQKDYRLISLSQLGRFLAEQAIQLGVEIYTGFAATELLKNEHDEVIGVKTGPQGLDKTEQPTPKYEPGLCLYATQTLLAEGCRGQLSEQAIQHYQLRKNRSPQTYALGIKEIWKIPHAEPGKVIHTIGWPLKHDTYGGSFLYHLDTHRIAIGFVVGLDYQNPWLDPFQEFQQFKRHPFIQPHLKEGERLEYGARALVEGGFQALPQLAFPGGLLLGDAAGFLNVPRMKGIHMAIESGMLAADACLTSLKEKTILCKTYDALCHASPTLKTLHRARNIRPGFQKGLGWGLLNAAFETYISRGRSPWTLQHQADHTRLRYAYETYPIPYPKPDGILTFDKASSVYLSNTHHRENQPCHLKIKNFEASTTFNHTQYASPETRYCPAGVYEWINDDHIGPHLAIYASNCLHCKTCDIKDPDQNIQWTAPEGGGGPHYDRA